MSLTETSVAGFSPCGSRAALETSSRSCKEGGDAKARCRCRAEDSMARLSDVSLQRMAQECEYTRTLLSACLPSARTSWPTTGGEPMEFRRVVGRGSGRLVSKRIPCQERGGWRARFRRGLCYMHSTCIRVSETSGQALLPCTLQLPPRDSSSIRYCCSFFRRGMALWPAGVEYDVVSMQAVKAFCASTLRRIKNRIPLTPQVLQVSQTL